MEENIALEKKFQNKFAKKVKKAKQETSGEPVQNVTEQAKAKRGVVYVGHVPHGFYEKEMSAYFKQFGRISSIRLCRSSKTGRSKGYAFVEFHDPEVANIAAETMNNYLMFNRRLEAIYISSDQPQRQRKFKPPVWSASRYPLKVARKKMNMDKNKNIDDDKHIAKSRDLLATVNKTLDRLKKLGINYQFQAVDIPDNLNVSENSAKLRKTRKRKAKTASSIKKQKVTQKEDAKENVKKALKKKNIVRKK